MSPVAVSGDGIDLTVVRDQTEWLCKRPLWQGIGRETLMEHADGGFHAVIAQIRIKLIQIGRHHQAFVGDNFVRQTTDVKIAIGLHGDFRLATHIE